jgi:hypothetical protein
VVSTLALALLIMLGAENLKEPQAA